MRSIDKLHFPTLISAVCDTVLSCLTILKTWHPRVNKIINNSGRSYKNRTFIEHRRLKSILQISPARLAKLNNNLRV